MKYLFALILVSCSGLNVVRLPSSHEDQNGWGEYLTRTQINPQGMHKFFPDPEYLGPWQKNTDFVFNDPLPPEQIPEKPFACEVKKLYPTHPSQSTKEYLYAVYSQYDHGRLPPDSYACLQKNPTGKFCVRAAIAMMVVMSDTFTDECGNFYRGYWLVTYLKSDENMGTLFSRGRSAYEKPDAQFPGEFIEDNTYAVPMKEFMFLGELLPNDSRWIEQEKARALRSGFRMNGLLFVR